jgi:SagB-type dehydrogenase family enzyme
VSGVPDHDTTGAGRPQVLIVVTARFQRMSWKYEAIGYALMLKNLGCLLQTMYLTATALNLALCAVGGGNTATFARLTGIPALVEARLASLSWGPVRRGEWSDNDDADPAPIRAAPAPAGG